MTCCSPQVKDCVEHAVLPMDGATLAEVMRQRGINMRYLGKVLELVLRSPARHQLDHVYVSAARAGAEWELRGGMEARGLTETALLNPSRKSALENSSPARPSTSSRRTYRCHPSAPWLAMACQHGVGPQERA